MKKILYLLIFISLLLSACNNEIPNLIPEPEDEFEVAINKFSKNGIPDLDLLETDMPHGTFVREKVYPFLGALGNGWGQPRALVFEGAKLNTFHFSVENPRIRIISYWKFDDNKLIQFNCKNQVNSQYYENGEWIDDYFTVVHYDGQYLLLKHIEFKKEVFYLYVFVPGNDLRDYYINQYLNETEENKENLFIDTTDEKNYQ